jgi:signal-transduction protein with cAMP-binding, CBS, and nucleotidyltransferase domain
MKSSHEKDVKEKIAFLKHTVPFEDWSVGLLKEIAQEAKWVTFQIGDEICTEGNSTDHVLFLKKGVCKVYANYEMDRERGRVKIGQLGVSLLN